VRMGVEPDMADPSVMLRSQPAACRAADVRFSLAAFVEFIAAATGAAATPLCIPRRYEPVGLTP
jgi:hypothetical protein